MTEPTTEEVHALVNELEALSESGKPGAAAAWFKLHQLANTTGAEWDALVRKYLDKRAADSAGATRERD